MSEPKCSDVLETHTQVPAIEVCTIETAKKRGIFATNGFYEPGYTDLKTYIDDDASRTKEVCSSSADGADAYMFCSVEHNNIAYKRKGNKCVTYACPTGWDGVSTCKKPLEDAIVSKRAHCDERWHDWFTVPNYHLGNKYQADEKVPGKCFNPCPTDHVPHYKNDPVDGSTFGISSKQSLDRCVPRNQYFGGKYYGGSDFCPLSWVYRIGASTEKLRDLAKESINKVKEEGNLTNADFAHLIDQNTLDSTAAAIRKNTSSVLENITAPKTRAMQSACRSLQTPERLSGAYDICEKLSKNEEAVLDEYIQSGDAEEAATRKLEALKQACNATFCDANNDAALQLKKEPLCFKTNSIEEGAVKKVTVEDRLAKIDGMTSVKRSLSIAIYIIMVACMLALLVVVYKYIKPYIRKFVLFIVRLIMRVPKEVAIIEDQVFEAISKMEEEIAKLHLKLKELQ